MTREKFKLEDFYMTGHVEANNEKEVEEIVSAFNKIATKMKPEKLIGIARKINGKDGDNIIKKMQAYL